MLTARAEYRLLLREDNADLRLGAIGYQIGLLDTDRYKQLQAKERKIMEGIQIIRKHYVSSDNQELQQVLQRCRETALNGTSSLADLLKRPRVRYEDLQAAGLLPEIAADVAAEIEMTIKYEGYIAKEKAQVERLAKLEKRKLSDTIDYRQVKGLSRESVDHLERVKPCSLGQALRIPGVTPADINVLLVYLEQKRREGANCCAG
jgi:tRNA uridine 5-carboxymethylaminomethyl modification enzyme